MITLADQIIRFKPNKFTCVVGIARGGLIPACYLANQLEIPYVYTVGVKSYSKTTQTELAWYHDCNTSIPSNSDILLVDDLCDTGDTMIAVRDKLLERNRVFTATIFYKPKSRYRPDAYWQEVDNNHWIVFPWEKQEGI